MIPLGEIENDDSDPTRQYIPLPGNWEVQTKGKGSSYRLLDKKTKERHLILSGKDWEHLQAFFTRFALELHAACKEPLKIKPIEWTEPERPDKESHYDHVFGKCGLGKFSIEWKSWKQYDSYSVTLCHGIVEEYVGEGFDLDEAKRLAYDFLCAKISSCISE